MASAPITLHGYQFSVYTRIVRIVLTEKGVDLGYVETDPFQDTAPARLLRLHPFQRVPVLTHGDFALYETAAITRYLDDIFPRPLLTPPAAKAAARMQQVIGIVDSYGYLSLVRQVFSNLVFRPAEGGQTDWSEVRTGLATAEKVLTALDQIAAEGLVPDADNVTLADCHLIPMVDYFLLTAEGKAMFRRYPALCGWWSRIGRRASVAGTRPHLSQIRPG